MLLYHRFSLGLHMAWVSAILCLLCWKQWCTLYSNLSPFVWFPIFVFLMLRVCCVLYVASVLRDACVITDSCVSAEEEIQGSMSKFSWDFHTRKVALAIVRLYMYLWVSDVQNVQILDYPLITF